MFTLMTDKTTISKQSISNKLDTKYLLQQMHGMTAKLEFAQQEIRIINFEKLELQKEIDHLKQQNQELIQENNSYFESSKIEQQQILFLRSVSSHINEINLYNDTLNIQISEYKKLIKKLNSKNINLQKENEKYQIILEQLNEEKQKRDEINMNNTLNLENKIKDLQNECDRLREEMDIINILNTSPMTPEQTSYSRPTSTKYKEKSDLFRIECRSLNGNDKPLFSEFSNKSYSNYSEIEIISNDYDEHDVMNQLLQFGYNEYEINTAMNTIKKTMDINEMVQVIENTIDCKCEQYHDEIQAKIAEINRLKVMNDDNKSIIKTLQKRIRISLRENKVLLSKTKNNDNRCMFYNWFSN